jgi:hypothetical protein
MQKSKQTNEVIINIIIIIITTTTTTIIISLTQIEVIIEN